MFLSIPLVLRDYKSVYMQSGAIGYVCVNIYVLISSSENT